MSVELKEFAKLLDGRQIGDEVSRELSQLAMENNFVIIHGASDDLAIIDGAISDECGGLYNGGEIAFVDGDIFSKECDDDDCPHESRIWDQAIKVEAEWCAKDKPCWSYTTSIPHEKFSILEDGQAWCEGIVFKIESIL